MRECVNVLDLGWGVGGLTLRRENKYGTFVFVFFICCFSFICMLVFVCMCVYIYVYVCIYAYVNMRAFVCVCDFFF